MIFAFFVENHLLGITKLSFLVLWFKLQALQGKGLIFLLLFAFFVENHLLRNAIDHEMISTVILSLPLIQEGQFSVTGKRMCTILVNRLED